MKAKSTFLACKALTVTDFGASQPPSATVRVLPMPVHMAAISAQQAGHPVDVG